MLAWELWSECLAADDSSKNCGEDLMVLTGQRESEGSVGTESVSGYSSLCASKTSGRAAPRRVIDVLTVLL